MIKNLKNKKTWLITFSLVMLLTLGIIGSVSAAEFPKGETIPVSQTIDDDVFISGMNVVVDGNINGILFASGQTVTINGTVVGDAVLTGETITVNEGALIDGNLFVGSAEVIINGTVTGSIFGGSASMDFGKKASAARNLFYGGFSFNAAPGSSVGRDMYIGAYQAILSGAIARDLKIGAAALDLNGSIGRDATIDIGEVDQSAESTAWMEFNPWINKYIDQVVQPGLRVADGATIAGKSTFISSVDASSQLDAVTTGSVIYQTPVPYTEGQPGKGNLGDVKEFRKDLPARVLLGTALSVTRSFIKLFVLGALALWLLAKPFRKVVEAAYSQPMKAMGWGFVIIAIGFLAAFIVPLVFVMVGVLIGIASLGSLLFVWFGLVGTSLLLVSMLFFFTVFTLSQLVAAYMFGKWLMAVVFKQGEEKVWLNLLVGVFLYVLLRAIPILGWLAALAATLIGIGAFWLALSKKKEN